MTHRNSYAFSYLFLFIRSSWCCQSRCKQGPKEINHFILFHFSLVHSVSLEEQINLYILFFLLLHILLLYSSLSESWCSLTGRFQLPRIWLIDQDLFSLMIDGSDFQCKEEGGCNACETCKQRATDCPAQGDICCTVFVCIGWTIWKLHKTILICASYLLIHYCNSKK